MNQDKIGKFLASLRKENNLTQEDIAEKLNVNVKSVSRWENGRNLPDSSIMKEICKIYNVSINELFNGEKVKKSNKVRQIFLFYIIVSLTGIFILPTLGIIAPAFIISAILCPIFGLVKLIGYIFKFDVPFVMFEFGSYSLNPVLGFVLSIIVGVVLFIIGVVSWKLLIKYIHFVTNKRKKLYIEL